jgi:hypothetical protein
MPGSQEVASPLPPALLRSPRGVRRKPGTLGLLLVGRILTAPVLAVAAALTGLVVLDAMVAVLIPAQPARIVGLSTDPKGRGGVAYYVEYELDRSGFIGRDEAQPLEYQTFYVGQAVKARVLHLGQLGYSVLDRSLESYVGHRLILWLGALFALAIGGVLFYAIWLMPWRSHWLARHGKATFGAVVSKSIFHGGRRQVFFTLTYQFKAMGTLQSRRIRISSQRFDSSGIKDLVIILFDPKRPVRSIVYDYCDFIVS